MGVWGPRTRDERDGPFQEFITVFPKVSEARSRPEGPTLLSRRDKRDERKNRGEPFEETTGVRPPSGAGQELLTYFIPNYSRFAYPQPGPRRGGGPEGVSQRGIRGVGRRPSGNQLEGVR